MRILILLLRSRASLWDLHHLVPLVGMVEEALQPGRRSVKPNSIANPLIYRDDPSHRRRSTGRQTVVRVGFIMKISTSGFTLLAVDASHDA